MNELRRLNRPKCDCGRAVDGGSVFCPQCKATIERANAKTLGDENIVFQKLVRKRK